jgi:pimeloyl-ACP methyl ester carboxylesterase
LHGFGEFWWAWRHQIPELDAAGLSVAAMDVRGYGASDKTAGGYDPHTTAYDVAGVIKSLGFSQGVVVGHDWGRMAAWATLAYAAGPVRAVVSVAAPHPLAFPWRANLPTLAFFQIPLLPERRMMADDGLFVEQLLRSPSGRRGGPDDRRRGPELPGRADAVAKPALCSGVPADVRPQPGPSHGLGAPPGSASRRLRTR